LSTHRLVFCNEFVLNAEFQLERNPVNRLLVCLSCWFI